MPSGRQVGLLPTLPHPAAAGFESAPSVHPGTAGSGGARARPAFSFVRAVLLQGSGQTGSPSGLKRAIGFLWTVRTRDGIEPDDERIDDKSDGHKDETICGFLTGTDCNGF